MKNIIRAGWNGETRGWLMFWIYGHVVPVGITFLFAFVNTALAQVAVSGWSIWWLFSAWRCAFNVKWNGWGYILRAYIILDVAMIPLGIGFFLDQWLSTSPWGILFGLLVSVGITIFLLFKIRR